MSDFLGIYNEELRFLRHRSVEFAGAYPNVARQLGLHRDGAEDPLVERMLEGTAFLTARVHQRLENEQASLVVNLMGRLCPLWYTPTPSIATIEVQPDFSSPSTYENRSLPKGTQFTWRGQGQKEPVRFRTARELALWPMSLRSARLDRTAPDDLPRSLGRALSDGVSFLDMQFECKNGLDLPRLGLDELEICLVGEQSRSLRLLRALHGGFVRLLCCARDGNDCVVEVLESDCLRMPALADDGSHELLPASAIGIGGIRVLREYFSAPSAFLSLAVAGLERFAARCKGLREFRLCFVLDGQASDFIGRVAAEDFSISAVPCVNLIKRRCDPLLLRHEQIDQHLLVDRLRPRAFKVHSVKRVQGTLGDGRSVDLAPLHAMVPRSDSDAFTYHVHRDNRTSSDILGRSWRKRLDADGDVYLSLGGGGERNALTDLRSLHVTADIFNANISFDEELVYDLQCEDAQPIRSARFARWPSKPRLLPDLDTAWQAIQIANAGLLVSRRSDRGELAQLYRLWLQSCAGNRQFGDESRIESIKAVDARHGHARMRGPGPVNWGREISVDIEIDAECHPDGGAYLFSAVLHAALVEHRDINQDVRSCFRLSSGSLLSRWHTRIDGGKR